MIQIKAIASSSAGNCIAVSCAGTTILLDAGIPLKQIQRGLNFELPAAVLLSHGHRDHTRSAIDLAKLGVDSYGPEDALDGFPARLCRHRGHIVEHGDGFEPAPGWWAVAFHAVHDAPCVGYIIRPAGEGKVLYLTDSGYCPFTFRQGFTHILVECNYSEAILRRNLDEGLIDSERYQRTLRNHMSLERVLGMLKVNDLSCLREVWLLHLSAANANAAEFKAAVERATGKPVFIAPAKATAAEEIIQRIQGEEQG